MLNALTEALDLLLFFLVVITDSRLGRPRAAACTKPLHFYYTLPFWVLWVEKAKSTISKKLNG